MVKTTKITLTINKVLLERVDAAATSDYTTRSDVIRQALVDYLRDYERACGDLEPEAALRVLRQRLGRAHLNETLKNRKP